jgi:hypothetical protein
MKNIILPIFFLMWFFLQKMMQLHPEEPEDALLDQLIV